MLLFSWNGDLQSSALDCLHKRIDIVTFSRILQIIDWLSYFINELNSGEAFTQTAGVNSAIAGMEGRVTECSIPLFAGVMSLLRPLLLDIVPTIQQTAALALGRLANYNDDLAEAVVKGDILPQLVYSLAEQNVRPSDNDTKDVNQLTCYRIASDWAGMGWINLCVDCSWYQFPVSVEIL